MCVQSYEINEEHYLSDQTLDARQLPPAAFGRAVSRRQLTARSDE